MSKMEEQKRFSDCEIEYNNKEVVIRCKRKENPINREVIINE